AKGNPAQPRFTQRIGQGAAQMPAPDRFGVDHPYTGKGQSRFGIASAKGRQPGDVVDQRTLRRGKRERCVDAEFRYQLLAVEAIAQALGEKPAQSVEIL